MPADRPLYVDQSRRGDVIVVGYGGDNPEVSLRKIMARGGDDTRGWPEGFPAWPDRFAAGRVTRAPGGVVTEYATPDGARHNLRAGKASMWRVGHAESYDDADTAVAFAAQAPTFVGAWDVLDCHRTRPPRAHPNPHNQ